MRDEKRTATGQKWPFPLFRRKREEDLSLLVLDLTFYFRLVAYLNDEIPSLNKACYVYTARGGLSR